MPGVPSSRNCDACRKQKKSCDTDTPPCSRCKRLGIPCVNLGQKRWKFQSEQPSSAATTAVALQPHRPHESARGRRAAAVLGAPVPGNVLTRLTNSAVRSVDQSEDVSVQLIWNFGTFLQDIPQRLGVNESMDAACDLLFTVYDRFRRGIVQPNSEVFVKHSHALRTLRDYLDDPRKAHSSETLAAIMILMTSSSMISWREKTVIGHSAGAAMILKARGNAGPQNEFENKLLMSLRGPVIFEGLLTDKVHLSRQEWHDLVENHLDSDTDDGATMRTLAHVPILMRKGREALNNWPESEDELVELRLEAKTLRENFQRVIKNLRERLDPKDISIKPEFPGPTARILHSHYTRMYGLALTTGIIINCVSHALEGGAVSYQDESEHMAQEILGVARISDQYRPLGAMYLTICLIAAWVGAYRPETKSDAEEWLQYYQQDFGSARCTITDKSLEWVEDRFALRETVPYHLAFSSSNIENGELRTT